MTNQDITAVFLAKTEVLPSGCHAWTAARDRRGYGFFWHSGTQRYAHRSAFMLFVGEIPEGFHVLHQCDNPSCVNPAHLFLGTHSDNMADKKNKGRQVSGVRHKLAKLTWDQVVSARVEWRDSPVNQRALARKYGVAQSTMSSILLGKHRLHS